MTDPWASVADGLYMFILKYCTPSAMTPPEALTALRDYEMLKRR